jgi:hypothetical protein
MQLNFPTYKFKTKREQNINYVFDIVRKKYVVLTPEEWVRQHLIHYLTEDKHYPQSLLSVERGLELNGLRKRFDLLAFNKNGQPHLLIECKSPEVELNKAVFEQIAVYNARFKVTELLVSNGLQHIMIRYSPDFSGYEFLPEIPAFQ